MRGTFTGTGRAPDSVKGGTNKRGLLVLDFGTGTVALEVSIDGGITWVQEGTYSADTVLKVDMLDSDALYTLNCTVYTADIEYSLSS